MNTSRRKEVEERRMAGALTVGGENSATLPAEETRQRGRPLEHKKSMRRRRRTHGQLNGHPLPDVDQVPLFVRNVATWHGLGFSLHEISAQSGVTPQALSVMLVRQRASLLAAALGPGELAGLSPRAVSCLGRLGVGTREKARSIKDLEARLRMQRNCGRKTIREILEWAGVVSP